MSAGLDHYQRFFSARAQHPMPRRRELYRASLPTPRQYLSQHNLLVRTSRGDWAEVRCPIHKGGNEEHPSMRISLVDGHFACHACGAKGGDIVALHMLRTGLRFPEAVCDLGGRFHE